MLDVDDPFDPVKSETEPEESESKPKELWYPRPSKDGNWGVVKNDPAGHEWIIMPQPPRSPQHMTMKDCDLIARTHNAAQAESFLFVNPELSHRTHGPLVAIAWGAESAKLEMKEAYQIAHQLLDAIHAAMADAVMLRFLQQKVFDGAKDEETLKKLVSIIVELRNHRHGLLPESMKQDSMFIEEDLATSEASS